MFFRKDQSLPLSLNPPLVILCESYSRNIFPHVFKERLKWFGLNETERRLAFNRFNDEFNKLLRSRLVIAEHFPYPKEDIFTLLTKLTKDYMSKWPDADIKKIIENYYKDGKVNGKVVSVFKTLYYYTQVAEANVGKDKEKTSKAWAKLLSDFNRDAKENIRNSKIRLESKGHLQFFLFILATILLLSNFYNGEIFSWTNLCAMFLIALVLYAQWPDPLLLMPYVKNHQDNFKKIIYKVFAEKIKNFEYKIQPFSQQVGGDIRFSDEEITNEAVFVKYRSHHDKVSGSSGRVNTKKSKWPRNASTHVFFSSSEVNTRREKNKSSINLNPVLENVDDDLTLIRGTSNFYVEWNEARIKDQLPPIYHYLITKFSNAINKGLIAWGSVGRTGMKMPKPGEQGEFSLKIRNAARMKFLCVKTNDKNILKVCGLEPKHR